MEINQLADLNKYKTAPILDPSQSKKLSEELDSKIVILIGLLLG
tara:strand:- start:453 stop:584 length:132 start_codon:yes stop_codon:yes gene_type:complete